jgi:hypothetical protein
MAARPLRFVRTVSNQPAILRLEASSHLKMGTTQLDGRNRTKKKSEKPCDGSNGQNVGYYLKRSATVKFCLFPVHPVSAILLGVTFLGEHIQIKHLVGMGLIGLGLAAIDGRALDVFKTKRI